MALKQLDPQSIPAKPRQARSGFSEDQIAEAVQTLKAGQAVAPDEEFKNEGAARRAALKIKHAIEGSGARFNGKVLATRVWMDGDKARCAVVLKDDTKAA